MSYWLYRLSSNNASSPAILEWHLERYNPIIHAHSHLKHTVFEIMRSAHERRATNHALTNLLPLSAKQRSIT